jgi:hypothetical protein
MKHTLLTRVLTLEERRRAMVDVIYGSDLCLCRFVVLLAMLLWMMMGWWVSRQKGPFFAPFSC